VAVTAKIGEGARSRPSFAGSNREQAGKHLRAHASNEFLNVAESLKVVRTLKEAQAATNLLFQIRQREK
jgi:hypothetical protein